MWRWSETCKDGASGESSGHTLLDGEGARHVNMVQLPLGGEGCIVRVKHTRIMYCTRMYAEMVGSGDETGK